MQDHKIYPSSIEQVWKHQKHKRSSKDFGRRYEERSTRSQHIESEEKDVSQKLKRSSEFWKIFKLQKHL